MPKRKPKDTNRSPDLPQNWVERHIERLEELCFYAPIPITPWDHKRSKLVAPGQYEPIDDEWGRIDVGETWGGPDTTAHFRSTLVLPESHAGENAYLDIDMDGGETQLSINGRPWQGLDHFRSLVPLGELAVVNTELSLEMEAFTINYPYDARRNDARDYHVFKRANVVMRDPVIESCMFDMLVVFEAYLHYWKKDAEHEIEGFLLKHLENACRLLGPKFGSRDEAQKAATNASKLLQEEVLSTPYFRHDGTIDILAHSHLDIVYLWPIKETLRKNGRTTSNALSLLREYPNYVYSASQTYLYEELEEQYPTLFDEVKAMIAAGRWETVGALYVEPDGNLVGPESWVRQILFGKRYLRESLSSDSRVCWLPDVFGLMHTLPQILKKSGIDYFLTAKLNIWNDTTVFPYDSFRWRGPDGSEVIAHFPPTHFAQDFTYENLDRHWQDYTEKHETGENLFIYGWGDGGGGPTRKMVEFSKRSQSMPGLPDVIESTAESFFDRLAKKSDALPVWDDELYMEGHRGTYTSRAKLKKYNRTAEFLYRDVEILGSLASVFGGPSIQSRLNEGWKLLLLNQFHDTLPGTHVPAADADIEQEYKQVFEIGYGIRDELLEFVASRLEQPASLIVVNTLGDRKAIACADISDDVRGLQFDSKERKTVQRDNGKLYFEVELPSMGWIALSATDDAEAPSESTAVFDDNEIDTPLYRLKFDEAGRISRLYDKRNDRDVLNGPGNEFQAFEDDSGKKFGAWDVAYHLEEYRYPVRQTRPWKMVANGPLFARFVSEWQVQDSTIEQEMLLYRNDPRIDFKTRVDWQNEKKLLKVAFPLNIRSRAVAYDLPFGHLERPAHRNTGTDQAKFEVSAHKWADMSEGDYGVALLNDCKYGYDARGNVLRLSLVRSPVHPFPASDIGEHTFSYALLPHSGDWRQANIDKEGYAFNCPPIVSRIQPEHIAGELPPRFSFMQLDSNTAITEVIKQAENGDGLIVRAFDSHGTHNEVTFSFAQRLASVEETDLLEEQPQSISGGDGVSLRFTPYEIKTLRIRPKPVLNN